MTLQLTPMAVTLPHSNHKLAQEVLDRLQQELESPSNFFCRRYLTGQDNTKIFCEMKEARCYLSVGRYLSYHFGPSSPNYEHPSCGTDNLTSRRHQEVKIWLRRQQCIDYSFLQLSFTMRMPEWCVGWQSSTAYLHCTVLTMSQTAIDAHECMLYW